MNNALGSLELNSFITNVLESKLKPGNKIRMCKCKSTLFLISYLITFFYNKITGMEEHMKSITHESYHFLMVLL